MTPDSLDPRLQPYLDGELSEAERAALEDELTTSEELRGQLARLDAANALARRSEPPVPPAGLEERLLARALHDPGPWYRRLLPGPGRSGPILAWGFATTCLLAVLLFPFAATSREKGRSAVDRFVTVKDRMTQGVGKEATPGPAAGPPMAALPPRAVPAGEEPAPAMEAMPAAGGPSRAAEPEDSVAAPAAPPVPAAPAHPAAPGAPGPPGPPAGDAMATVTREAMADVFATAPAEMMKAPTAGGAMLGGPVATTPPPPPGGPAGGPPAAKAAPAPAKAMSRAVGEGRARHSPAAASGMAGMAEMTDSAGSGRAFRSKVVDGDVHFSVDGARVGESVMGVPMKSPQAQAPAERLQAGEVDDNELFGKYLEYAGKMAHIPAVKHFGVRERYFIRVVDRDGRAVPDREVSIYAPWPKGKQPTIEQMPLYHRRTDSAGVCLYFAGTHSLGGDELRFFLDASAADLNDPVETISRRPEGQVVTLTDRAAEVASEGLPLDVAFVVDTTGSMSAEIDRVRGTIKEVAQRIGELPAHPRLRLGLVIFRDRGDQFVIKAFKFTGDPNAFHDYLTRVKADGGGDEPEDVNRALAAAMNQLDWTQEHPALRLAFLIGDAPPHLDYKDETPYFSTAMDAARRGMKFFCVAATDMNYTGEYVWRQVALLTRGRFAFITRGGAAGETPHHVARQDYSVQALPDLILNDVARELAALGQPAPEPPAVVMTQSTPPPVPAPPAPAPQHARQIPLWLYLLVLAANLCGWLYAWRRARQPWREEMVRPDVPHWKPPR